MDPGAVIIGEVGTYTIEDGIGVILTDNPPVNALGIKARIALDKGFRKFAAEDSKTFTRG
jgi:3-hydroxyacyl-CoA dehydrogenase